LAFIETVNYPCLGLHHVVAVKVVATEAREPPTLPHELEVGNVEGIFLHLQRAVTAIAVARLHRDTCTRVLAVTAFTAIGPQHLPRFGKAGLAEAKGWMTIERSLVTCQAIVVVHPPESEVSRRLA
jgi:hypothetical protein